MKEWLKGMWKNIMKKSMSMPDGELSFEIINSWADKWKIKMIIEDENIALVRSSAWGNDWNKNKFEFIKSEGAETSEKIESIAVTLSSIFDNFFWICAKRKTITIFEIENVTWITINEKMINSFWITF